MTFTATIRNIIKCFVALLLLGLFSGCAEHATTHIYKELRSEHYPDVIVLKTKKEDSFSSLAEKYLGDPRKGYLISEFNNLKELAENQELIIPLEPFRLGGIDKKTYQTVPILTYHNFSENKTTKMTVKKSDFEIQMKYLKDNGYHVISMKDFIDFLDYKKQIPKKSVVITFDDGWRSFYKIAYPILKKYGYPATLFVYTDLITGRGNHLSWDEIIEMSNNGINMQSHTLSHRYLNKRKPEESYLEYAKQIDRELKKSAKIIETKTGKNVEIIAYPYGETNHLASAYTAKNGYIAAFTVEPQANPFNVSRLRISRMMIMGDYSIDKFSRKLKTYEYFN